MSRAYTYTFSTAAFVRGVTDALWLPAWADEVERRGGKLPHRIDRSTAPRAPARARALAVRFAGKLQRLNGVPLHRVWQSASRADGRAVDPEELGYYLAMQGQGHGVSWFDDHASFPVRIPRVEAYALSSRTARGRRYSLEGSGFGKVRSYRDRAKPRRRKPRRAKTSQRRSR